MYPRLAAVLALASFACFAVTGYLTQRAAAHFAIMTVLAFRTIVGSVLLAIFVFTIDRAMTPDAVRVPYRVQWWQLFRSTYFWTWTILFALTVALYGLAVAGTSIANVLLIATFMPLVVLCLEAYLGRSQFRLGMALPFLWMFVWAMLPHAYNLGHGNIKSVVSWGSLFAISAAICHAIWAVFGTTVREDTQDAREASRTLWLFVLGGVWLLFMASNEAVQVSEAARGHGLEDRILPYLRLDLVGYISGDGLLSAASVLFFILATANDAPGNVAPYQYTLAFWGLVLTLVFERDHPQNTSDVLIMMGVASFAILVGAVWLHVKRTA